MARLLVLSNDNLTAPNLIHGVVKFPGKGVALRNEYNKIIDFIKEPDARRQNVIVIVIGYVTSTRDWVQPNWDEEFATAP